MSLRTLDASGGADLDGSDADTKQDGFTPLKRCPGEINLTSAETYKERQRLLGLDALKFDVELSEASSGDHIGVLDDDAQRSVSMSGYLADDAADAGGVASRQHVSDEQDYAASQPQLNHLYRNPGHHNLPLAMSMGIHLKREVASDNNNDSEALQAARVGGQDPDERVGDSLVSHS